MRKIPVALALLLLLCGPVYAAGEIDTLKGSLSTAVDDAEKARIYGRIGDAYSAKDDFKSAGPAYRSALNLSRDKFTVDDRMTFATRISWGGFLDDAISEFRAIVKENPDETRVRVALARTLSWRGDLTEAEAEADKVIASSPGNKDALIVKANCMRWGGRNRQAAEIYRKVLESGEDFDARLGLTFALLFTGDTKVATESRAMLKASMPYQERELVALDSEMRKETGQQFDLKATIYHDSDHNRVPRYSFDYRFRLLNVKMDLKYVRTDAQDPTRNKTADAASISGSRRIGDAVTVSAGAGAIRMGGARYPVFPTGHVSADFSLGGVATGIGVEKAGMTDTAQIIDNGIRYTGYGATFSRGLPHGASLYGAFSHRKYSDNNSAIDVQVSPSYLVIAKDPRFSVGYRFRYLDFDRQSRGGYYDPNNLLAHAVFVNLSYERDWFYSVLEPYAGYQTGKRYGMSENGSFKGGYAMAGAKAGEHVTGELSIEAGNSGIAGGGSGFWYYQAGARLIITP